MLIAYLGNYCIVSKSTEFTYRCQLITIHKLRSHKSDSDRVSSCITMWDDDKLKCRRRALTRKDISLDSGNPRESLFSEMYH